ncbi:MAG: DeoR/GlpR transcriptional regulator [Clostridium sp.]|nr:DeoR/GlpR transcriptional regulator [Clostridium sp.]
MLTEERHAIILSKLESELVVYVNDLVKILDTSESTVRRDLTTLHKKGLLNKVHGGATSINKSIINTKDDVVTIRKTLHSEEKMIIAEKAARLIEANDMIYIDAGTTTELMIDFIKESKAVFVTNGIVHAKKLIQKGFKTFIIGGEIKLTTEAIVGVEAINSLRKYNFTKSFLGTNGVDLIRGFTTPDINEALVKSEAIKKSKQTFILSDSSKFDKVSSVTFCEVNEAAIITNKLMDERYKKHMKIMEVDNL